MLWSRHPLGASHSFGLRLATDNERKISPTHEEGLESDTQS
jgi:hypothetical protein